MYKKTRFLNQHKETIASWPHTRWFVGYNIDSRMNVTRVTATAIDTSLPDESYGHAAENVGPFDDLDVIVRRLMIDAVMNFPDIAPKRVDDDDPFQQDSLW